MILPQRDFPQGDRPRRDSYAISNSNWAFTAEGFVVILSQRAQPEELNSMKKKTRGTEKIYAQVVNIAYNFSEEGLKRCYSPAREIG